LEKTRARNQKTSRSKVFTEAVYALMQFLDATGRPSMIIGGVAVIAHGFARFTADIDATIAIELSELPKLTRAARRFGFKPRIENAERFARENLVLLLEHSPTRTPADISIALQPFEMDAAMRAEHVDFDGVQIRVPPLTSLIVYKMLASRPQDLQDVSALLKTGPYDRVQVSALLREFDALLETSRADDFERILGETE
jgi:hypothetical protein